MSHGLAGAVDRRNQRIMEWHQHLYDEERRGARPSRPSWKAALAIGLGLVLLRLLRPVLYDVLGVGWTIGMMYATATGAPLADDP